MSTDISEFPKHLYHYTSIETLEKILNSRKIRFRNLSDMDDTQEKMSSDLGEIGRFVFVSCWTAEETESIGMWNIYSGGYAGIRIKLPLIPFERKPISLETLVKNMPQPVSVTLSGSGPKFYIPEEHIYNDQYLCHALFNEDKIDIDQMKVQYTDDNKLLVPKLYTLKDDSHHISMGMIGKYKSLAWEFQKEWRYRILASPINISGYMLSSHEEQQRRINEVFEKISGNYVLPIDHIDLKIDDEKFKKMEITLGPEISDERKHYIEYLVNRYNPGGKIIDSSLKGLVKGRR